MKDDLTKQTLEIEDLEISTFLIGNSITQAAGDFQGKAVKQARNNVILKLHNGSKYSGSKNCSSVYMFLKDYFGVK